MSVCLFVCVSVFLAHGCIAGIFSFRYFFRWKKFVATSKWRPFWNFWNIRHSFILTSDTKRSPKIFFMLMTSSMTSQIDLKVGPLCSLINGIRTVFMISKTRTKISSLNFLFIGITGLWLHTYTSVFMTSSITSRGHKIGQIMKLLYIHQYFS